jgi:hypothetical protein
LRIAGRIAQAAPRQFFSPAIFYASSAKKRFEKISAATIFHRFRFNRTVEIVLDHFKPFAVLAVTRLNEPERGGLQNGHGK